MGREYDVTVDQVLVAVGRAPNVEGLELGKVGVEYSKKGVQIDEHFRVHVKKGSDQIVGATIVATNAGDMIGSFSIAMTQGIGPGPIDNRWFLGALVLASTSIVESGRSIRRE